SNLSRVALTRRSAGGRSRRPGRGVRCDPAAVVRQEIARRDHAYRSTRRHAMTLRGLDPRQSAEGGPVVPDPRRPWLRGPVLGLLDNARIGTARFSDHVEAILRHEHGVREVIRRRKSDATRPAPREIIAQLSGADALITGIGD